MSGARPSRPSRLRPRRRLATAVAAAATVAATLAALFGTAVPAAAAPAAAGHRDVPFLSQMVGGNAVGANVREERPRADGYRHLDTPAMIARLTAMHATHYTFDVWESPTDWDDLRLEFVPAARRAGIDVLVYLVPPSECSTNTDPLLDGRCAEPYRTDFVAWAKAIGRLAARYDNVTGWGIDDFLASDVNRALFTRDYLERVKGEQEKLAPKVKFYSTLYFDQLDAADLDLVTGVLDGVIYPYLGENHNTADPTYLEPRLDAAHAALRGRHLDLVLLVYAGRFLDSIVPPTETYVASVLRRAEPYVRDGRVDGIIAYASPLRLDLAQPSNEYRAWSGPGNLSLSTGNFTATKDGGWAQAAQRVRVDPHARRRSLTFRHHDDQERAAPGYHVKQLLVDGKVVWESDVNVDPGRVWQRTTVDLTRALAGRRSATLAFRLLDRHGVTWAPVDLRVDDVRARGLTVRNGGFDRPGGWRLSRTDPGLQPLLYTYRADRPVRIFDAIGAAYARLQGERFRPVPAPRYPGLRPSRHNQAMYGNGRLELGVPEGTAIPAGRCAGATQTVRVVPGQRRYELSLRHTDDTQAVNGGQVTKELLVDGRSVWRSGTADGPPWDYIEGSILQGPLDLTTVVRGHRSVDLTLRLCTTAPVTDYGFTAGFDHLHGQGLVIRDPDFETGHGWRTHADAPLTARAAVG